MAQTSSVARFLLFPAVAMSLGWGLRGFIAGGPLGAMIPGAMIGLVVSSLLRQERQAAWLAACASVGVGLGGQMTYGQTVGLSLKPETFWWAMPGFAIKGGVWGLGGGAMLGAGFLRSFEGWTSRRFLAGLAAMLAATWAGWRLVNAPKLIYFSDPVNKPREELWAGLLAGALAFLVIAAHGPMRRMAWRFALWACAGGALGFPLGATVQVWGRGLGTLQWLDWWKGMEFTLGALLGLGFGAAAWVSRREIAPESGEARREEASSMAGSLLAAATVSAVCICSESWELLRFSYSVGAALALAAALHSSVVARHVAVTVAIVSFLMNLSKKPAMAGAAGWAVVAALCVVAAVWGSRKQDPAVLFAGLTWSAVAVSLFMTFWPPSLASPGHLLTETLFLLMAWLCTRWMQNLHGDAAAGRAAVAS